MTETGSNNTTNKLLFWKKPFNNSTWSKGKILNPFMESDAHLIYLSEQESGLFNSWIPFFFFHLIPYKLNFPLIPYNPGKYDQLVCGRKDLLCKKNGAYHIASLLGLRDITRYWHGPSRANQWPLPKVLQNTQRFRDGIEWTSVVLILTLW